MILIVGGTSSGKATYARKLAAQHGWSEGGIAFNAEELLWRQDRDTDQITLAGGGAADDRTNSTALSATPELLERLTTKAIVTCSEVGGGIVPPGREERAWRENVGRMTCELSERATAVIRMVCGIPVVLKGKPED